MENYRNLVFRDKLDVILGCIDANRGNPEILNPYSYYLSPKKGDDPLFAPILELFDFDRVPQITKKDFDIDSFRLMFRGMPKKTYHANLLIQTGDRFHGAGKHGNGIYVTDDFRTAQQYALKSPEGDVMRLYLVTSQVATEPMLDSVNKFLKGKESHYREEFLSYDLEHSQKFIQTSEYSKERIAMLKQYIDAIQNPELKELFLSVLTRDVSKLGVLLGYDAIFPFAGTAGNVVVLNRNKIVVTQREYDRIYDPEQRERLKAWKPQNEYYQQK